MPLLETAIAAVGRLALAASYNGPALARVQSRAKDEQTSTPNERENVINVGPSFHEAAVCVSTGLAWLSERKTLTRHKLDRDAKAAVLFKDLLVAGSVITGLASLAGEALMTQKYPSGLRVNEEGKLSGESYRRYLKGMGTVNRAFVAGAVAATPFINFALFNAYKPNPVRSLFKL
jgi:hypothetical protein